MTGVTVSRLMVQQADTDLLDNDKNDEGNILLLVVVLPHISREDAVNPNPNSDPNPDPLPPHLDRSLDSGGCG